MNHRVVITGHGFVLPLGVSPENVLFTLQTKNTPFVPSIHDPHVAVCPVPDFDLKDHTGRFKHARYLSRGQQLGLAAAILALKDAGLEQNQEHCGLFLGLGPNLEARPRQDKALWLLDFLPNTLAACLAEFLGVHGENLTISTACAASTQALGQAYLAIAQGRLSLSLAGGGDSRLCLEGLMAYKQAGVLATDFTHAHQACRPFDQNRSGFAIGEGGAMFVLESLDHALKRKANILGEIMGTASSLDGKSLTSPDPQGRAAGLAVSTCLKNLDQEELCILAHGTGTIINDEVESQIIKNMAPQVHSICAFKSHIGHLASACGAAELALGLVCAKHNWFPAINNLTRPCDPDLPFLLESKTFSPKTLLVQSFGFGGQNACLAVRLWT